MPETQLRRWVLPTYEGVMWISGSYYIQGIYHGRRGPDEWCYQWYWSKASQSPVLGSRITIKVKVTGNDGAVTLSPEVVITVLGRR